MDRELPDIIKCDGKSDIENILKERGNRYGEFKDHAEISQGLKILLVHGASYDKLHNYQKESLEMICHKMARILNGDPSYIDSWTDIVGYAQLVIDELKKEIQ